MRHLPILHTLSALLLALLPVAAPAQTQPATSLPDLVTMETLGSDLFLQSGSTGMMLIIVRGDQVFMRGYGETSPGSNQVPTQDSVFRLCSLTKIFTTDVLTKLVADGTVQLDDPLQIYAPPHTTVPKRIRAITLADLATHTSGLPRELGNPPRGTPHFTFPDARTRWRWLPKQRLRSIPGTAALYSNVAFDLLSDALESATHKQYAALLAERTLNPLHMPNTTFFPTPQQCALLLTGADDEGLCTSTEETAGSSGLYSNATDMVAWLKYLLQRGDTGLQNPQAVYLDPAKLVKVQGLDHAGDPTGIGLGWIHLLSPDSPSHLVEKTGGGAGFSTYIALSHTCHTAIFLARTDGPLPPTVNVYRAANDLLLSASGLPPMPPPPPKPVAKRTRHRRRAAHK
jgi:serine-type D-Ala-D-Ala carboxypeptidase/endopeptidase